MEYKSITYTPGLYKIFDEILVNAADNSVRVKNMTEIRVTVDPVEGKITVFNDGDGIPIQMNSEHKIFIPEMIFGHLLSGSNFNDDEKRVVGGRNGYGAKLANIYSSKFQCEVLDSKKKKKFTMCWTKNMHTKSEPEIETSSERKD